MQNSRPPRGGPTTYTTSARDERSSRRSFRLTGRELQDLRDLWTGIGLQFGVRSAHGAVETRLLMAAPRNVSAPLLEELSRQRGRCSEGKLLRLVALEGWGVPNELRRVLKRLVREGRVERVPLPMPDVTPLTTTLDPRTGDLEAQRTNSEQLRMNDWTGFEIRLVAQPGKRIEQLTREERWRRDDEELEREWRVQHGSESHNASSSYDPAENERAEGATRAHLALMKMSERHAEILRTLFARHHAGEADEVEAVRALVGGDEERAREEIASACSAYKAARGS
jgi:hypothetical protein